MPKNKTGEIRVYVGGRFDLLWREHDEIFETKDIVGNMVARVRYNDRTHRGQLLKKFTKWYGEYMVIIKPDEINYDNE